MRRFHLALAALCAALALPAAASAQLLPFAVELRGGANLPRGEFAGEEEGPDAQTGLSFGASAAYSFFPGLALYAGYDRDAFDPGQVDGDLTSSGPRVGVRATVPGIIPLPVKPWVEAGAIFHELEADGPGTGAFTSDRGTGFEIGGGITLDFVPMLKLTPGVRYRSYTAEFGADVEDGPFDLDVSYFVFDLGVRLGL